MFQLFEFVNAWLPFSGVARIAVWAGVAGVISMLLYKRFSPQVRLEALMQELGKAQNELNEYDGEFDGMLPLLKRTLSLSLKRVWLSFAPSIVAAVPLIVVMVCIGYSHDHPSGQESPASVAQSVDVAGPDFAPDANNVGQPEKPAIGDQAMAEIAEDDAAFSPSWMRSWIFVFIVVSSCSALAVRQFGGII